MWIRNILTVAVSVVLSMLAAIAVSRNSGHQPSTIVNATVSLGQVRARKIELVDDQGRVRGAFELASSTSQGKEVPVLELIDDRGQASIVLHVDPFGAGQLAFNSNNPRYFREGVLTLGAMSGDTTSEEDNALSWGLKVQNSERNLVTMGLSRNGKPFLFPSLKEK